MNAVNFLKTAAILASLIAIIRAVAFFSSSETAFLSVSKLKMRLLLREKRKGAQKAAALRERMDELLTVVLIGTNFMNSFASALATALAVEIAGSGGVGIATALITVVATVFGQIIPKTAAAFAPEDTVCRNSFILSALKVILFPVVRLFTRISSAASLIAGRFLPEDGTLLTEDELKTLIEVGEAEGTLEKSESRMLYRIFEFGDLRVKSIMKHRALIKSLPQSADKAQTVRMFSESGLSMIPVYEGTKEKILGVIHYKSVLLSRAKDGGDYAGRIMKDALFVPESLSAPELLVAFKKQRTEFAVALNEQGETSGIVTMDDVMRAVFGRMSAEAQRESAPEQRIRLISPEEFVVPGDIKLDDLNAVFRLSLESEYFLTLGGWLLEKMGRLPSTGEVFRLQNALFTVEDQAQRRILSVRIRFLDGQGGNVSC
ncbi:MAG: hemolysin family protein [Treponema sp.]